MAVIDISQIEEYWDKNWTDNFSAKVNEAIKANKEYINWVKEGTIKPTAKHFLKNLEDNPKLYDELKNKYIKQDEPNSFEKYIENNIEPFSYRLDDSCSGGWSTAFINKNWKKDDFTKKWIHSMYGYTPKWYGISLDYNYYRD